MHPGIAVKPCALGPEFEELNEAESPEHFLIACSAYQEIRQKLWDQLNCEKDVAAKVQVLMAQPEEEKMHSMLDQEVLGCRC
jgi:hypothetical protein